MTTKQTSLQNTVVIIGGGMAGLSAAVHAIHKGKKPLVLEGARFAGGRVRSFYAPDFGSMLDNGQHVLAGAYHATREYLGIIGTASDVFFQKGFSAQFIMPSGKPFLLKAAPLPAPLHFLWPLLRRRRHHQIPFSDLVKFWFRCWMRPEAEVESQTVEKWLAEGGVSEKLTAMLMEPLCLATLNTPVKQASAALLRRTARLSFFHSYPSSGLGIPQKWLGDILVEPAVRFIRENGGEIQLFNPARKLITDGNRVTLLETRNEMIQAENVVLALPPHRLAQLLQNSPDPRWRALREKAEAFSYHIIMTVNIKLNRPIEGPFPKAFVNSPLQWLFPHPEQDGQTYGYSIVVSAAERWANAEKEEVLNAVMNELLRSRLLSARDKPEVLAYKIIREKSATISQTPALQQARPAPATPFSNTVLAGDWIQTALPATIESAVVSGRDAVNLLFG
ncbi:MAG: hydroxysqualene dehydroxylase HpnE [Calditrichia bacterium]